MAASSSINSSHLFTTILGWLVKLFTTIVTKKRFWGVPAHILSQYILDRTLL